MNVYQADSGAFDDSRTGYHETEEAALDAWWAENRCSKGEREEASPYANAKPVTLELIADAIALALEGSSSPALGIDDDRLLEKFVEELAELGLVKASDEDDE